jgi:hypothetical protein
VNRRTQAGIAVLTGVLGLAALPVTGQELMAPIFPVSPVVGDERVLTQHMDQRLIDAGRYSLKQISAVGQFLFDTPFTEADGQGRPLTNGVFPPDPRNPRVHPENFNRISGPEADSCAGCHNKPRSGGGGDNVANVFVLGQKLSFFNDPSQPDENGTPLRATLQDAADERNTLGMWGAGAIEMLAREMTAELLEIRVKAQEQASSTNAPATLPLVAKGISFGSITALPGGGLDTNGVEGVDRDLIIRPFSQKGVVVSLREFTNNAYPHHHGMQPVERFGAGTDTDGDGVTDELSVGDITAATVYQAQLAVPGQVIPRNPVISKAINDGERLFTDIGCASCHRPELQLNSPWYTEPNPYNPPFNLQPTPGSKGFRFDLTKQGDTPRIEKSLRGVITVRAFTDLKRHDLGNHPLINNERIVQNGVPTSVFITKKLWGFYSEPHFLHNGRCTLVSDAILAHGGEAQAARDNFASLTAGDRGKVIEFLKSLRVLPEGTKSLIVDEFGRPRNNLK